MHSIGVQHQINPLLPTTYLTTTNTYILFRYDPEPDSQGMSLSRSCSSRKASGSSSSELPRLSRDERRTSKDIPLEDEVKELREELDNLRDMYDMVSI